MTEHLGQSGARDPRIGITVAADQIAAGLVDLLDALFHQDEGSKHLLAEANRLANLVEDYRETNGWAA